MFTQALRITMAQHGMTLSTPDIKQVATTDRATYHSVNKDTPWSFHIRTQFPTLPATISTAGHKHEGTAYFYHSELHKLSKKELLELARFYNRYPDLRATLKKDLADPYYLAHFGKSVANLKVLMAMSPVHADKMLMQVLENADLFKGVICDRDNFRQFCNSFPALEATATERMLELVATDQTYFKAVSITAEEMRTLMERYPDKLETLEAWYNNLQIVKNAQRSRMAMLSASLAAAIPTPEMLPLA
jgi:hypothetical protein